MGVIRIVNGCKKYSSGANDSNVILNDFNMNVKRGSIYVLLGSSGCGKTTLISCMVGTNSLDSGSIQVLYDNVRRNSMKIGYMPQDIALINEFTISEMIAFYGVIHGMKASRIKERTDVIVDLLELPDSDKMVGKCSGGQQRRVSLACALVHEPEILILDEPTVGVDPLLRVKIWDFLIEMARTKNMTVLLSTHYIEEARQSTHVGIMRNGSLIAQDTPQNLLQKFATTSLEETFLRLSKRQENEQRGGPQIDLETIATTASEDKPIRRNRTEHSTANDGRTLRALISKNITQLVRNPA